MTPEEVTILIQKLLDAQHEHPERHQLWFAYQGTINELLKLRKLLRQGETHGKNP